MAPLRRHPPRPARLLPWLLFACLASDLAAEEPDPRVAWLREHSIEVSSLDPATVGFTDLAPLKEVLAGVDLVLLGEASHGDGSTLLAKTRLVHFLHREMGFEVLALDCGFYDCDRAWRRIEAGADARQALRQAVSAPYADAQEFRPLIDLVASRAQSDRPLAVAGFDHAVTIEAGARPLIAELRNLLGRLGAGANEIAGLDGALEIIDHLSQEAYHAGEPLPSRAARQEFDRTLAAIASRLAPAVAAGDREAAFWQQLLRSLGNHAETTWRLARWDPETRFARGAPHVPPEIQNLRYRQLAENLLWLARERYPGKRMIVWSTTVHLARDLDRLTTGEADTRERFDQFRVPGDFLAQEVGPRAYLLAFTAFSGHTGRALAGRAPSPLLVPTRGSFEDLMGRTGLAAAIVDLRGASPGGDWLRSALIARPISHKELLGIWHRHLDGLFFLRAMEPAHRRPEIADPIASPVPSPAPSSPPATLPPPEEMARCKKLIDAGQYAAARARLQPVVDQHPGWARATSLLALTYYRESRFEVAKPLFAKALAADPEELSARPLYGWSLYSLGELDPAEAMFRSLLERKPEYAPAHYALGLIHLDRDQVDAARERLETTIELAAQQADPPMEGRAHARLGDLYVRLDDLAAAKRELELAVRLFPDEHEALFKLSRVLQRLGDTEGAAAARARFDEAKARARPEALVPPS